MIFQNQSAHTLWLIDNEQNSKSSKGIPDYTVVLDFIFTQFMFWHDEQKIQQ